jgi:hypothetical protein
MVGKRMVPELWPIFHRLPLLLSEGASSELYRSRDSGQSTTIVRLGLDCPLDNNSQHYYRQQAHQHQRQHQPEKEPKIESEQEPEQELEQAPEAVTVDLPQYPPNGPP